MKVPSIEIKGKKYEIQLSAPNADLIIAFSDTRRTLPLDQFFEKHSEILAKVFNAPIQAIAKLSALEQVRIYLDCLEFVAKEIIFVAGGKIEFKHGKPKFF